MTSEGIHDLSTYLSEIRNAEYSMRSSPCWYRGHSKPNYKLLPSAFRDYSRAEERNLTNRFCARAAIRMPTAPDYTADARWLSIMQHYGLPTRLLDWSRSPLVALYFALEPYIMKTPGAPVDAHIWVLAPHRLNVSQRLGHETPSIESIKAGKLIAPAFSSKPRETNKVLAAMAYEHDYRMFVQQGAFTAHSYREPLEERKNCSLYLRRIVLKADRVQQLAADVELAGFRKGDIYPDLTNLATELKTAYPPRTLPPSP